MVNRSNRDRILRPSRRAFLKQLAACAGAAATPAGIAHALPADSRSLSFLHTHTGESLIVNYCCGGVYQEAALAQVNHFLRDFRNGEVHPIDPKLLDILYALQLQSDREGRFEVISGYRSPATNEALHERSSGVATHSLHLEGRAIDIRMSGFATARLHDLALNLRGGGVGFYPDSDFVHVDTGRVRFWQG
jgi:uncharacterized protein YcbK (DUF882 family)